MLKDFFKTPFLFIITSIMLIIIDVIIVPRKIYLGITPIPLNIQSVEFNIFLIDSGKLCSPIILSPEFKFAKATSINAGIPYANITIKLFAKNFSMFFEYFIINGKINTINNPAVPA